MAQNIKINGVTYNSVSSLSIPLNTGGGNAVFPDTSDATAVAGDIAEGKTAYVDGSKVTGTATGGGGGTTVHTITPTNRPDKYYGPLHGVAGDDIVVDIGGGMFAYVRDADNNEISFFYTPGWVKYFTMPDSDVTISIEAD